MSWLAIALLTGCEPGDARISDFTPHDAEPYFTDIPRTRYPRRARLIDETTGRLEPYGEPFEGRPFPYYGDVDLVVVEDLGEHIAVLYDGPRPGRMQMVVWLDRADLATTTVHETWMGGIRVPAGATLALEDHDPGRQRTRVWTRDYPFGVFAWVPDQALDQFWYADEPATPVEPQAGVRVGVRWGAELLDGPGGDLAGYALDTLSATLAGDHGPFLRVLIADYGWPADVWVHELDVVGAPTRPPPPSPPPSDAHDSWSTRCYFGPFNVRVDARLYSAPGGSVVGRMAGPSRMEAIDELDGWIQVYVRTPFGAAPVWIAPEDRLNDDGL